MINETLEFISVALNNHFKNVFQVTEDKTIVSNIINSDGSVPIAINDKLVVCLVNIEQETSIANLGFTHNTGQSFQIRNQPLNINLYILFAANFNIYSESLKFISSTISFFQGNYVFLKKNHPNMSENIDKLVFELLKTDYQSTNYLWNSLGAKYVPSMIYKVRMLTIDENNVRHEGSLISKTNVTTKDN
ncbi:MAG: DUF4255 domain-containing protein [Sphingobacteriaceae bacterium]|jgi:hypothetical protein